MCNCGVSYRRRTSQAIRSAHVDGATDAVPVVDETNGTALAVSTEASARETRLQNNARRNRRRGYRLPPGGGAAT